MTCLVTLPAFLSYGDGPVEEGVVGAVDDAHPAFAELVLDAVTVAEEGANHEEGSPLFSAGAAPDVCSIRRTSKSAPRCW